MALQTADPPVAPTPQVIANAFVEQYYHILHHSPESVYRFYQDSSVLSRQEENGEMTSVTAMQGINDKILSLDYKNYKAEIKTADAQESYKNGVIVLVTGCLTGKDNLRKNFAQSFFLAPQAKGYFVLNDVFRYVEKSEPLDTNAITVDKIDDSGAAQTAVYTGHSHTPVAPPLDVATSIENNQVQAVKPPPAFEKQKVVAPEEHVPATAQSQSHISLVAESSEMSAEEDAVKNSYASIVKKAKGSTGPTKVYVPANTIKSTTASTQKQPSGSVASTSVAQPQVNKNKKAPERVNVEEEGFSIYIRNLPINVMDAQLEEEFKRFGPIKPDGVQVRSNKHQGSCYGFVEFVSASSMENAIQASPVSIGGRKAYVELKRTITRVDDGQGKFPSGRGGFRSDSFRGRGGYGSRPSSRGGYGGGRGFSRNEFGGPGEYSTRGRGRGGESYQRARGRGRAGRGTDQS